MAGEKKIRLNQASKKLNVGVSTIVDFLSNKGFELENKPTTKISQEEFDLLKQEFRQSMSDKEEASELKIGSTSSKDVVVATESAAKKEEAKKKADEEKKAKAQAAAPQPKKEEAPAPKQEKASEPVAKETPAPKVKKEEETPAGSAPKMPGLKVLGKIDLDAGKKKPQPKKEAPKPAAEKPKAEAPKPKKEAPKPAATPKKEAPKKPVAEKAPTPSPAKKEEPVKKQEAPKPAAAKPQAEKPKAEKPAPPKETPAQEDQVIEAKADKLQGLKVLGKIELPTEPKKKKGPGGAGDDRRKKKRKRIQKDTGAKPVDPKQVAGKKQGQQGQGPGQGRKRGPQRKQQTEKEEISQKEIQEKIKATIAKMGGGKRKSSRSTHRRDKRQQIAESREEEMLREQEEAKTLRLTEFISANDLASLMDVSVNEVISTCMNLGMFVTINQRLDAELVTVIADEFGYNVEFITAEEENEESVEEIQDAEEDLVERAPIVTVMGHVDHGKTSLLDYIRNTKVTEGEAGGITQHIGAYSVMTESGKRIAFLDTPGHEAFTAMRARGAKVTDIVILVVAADDRVMPQTKEAINHAQNAGVPIIIAINKVDKPTANADKIREELSQENVLVEEWGGKYQAQEVSAKTGQGIDDLLEKVLLEAEVLELKANPDRKAIGTVVEASLDKGRGYLSTVLVQTGTLRVGDTVIAGSHYGRVKAMTDHKGKRLKEAGPSTPVQLLGLDGAPQSGDKITIADSDKEAREITAKRAQILREQSVRTQKHITIEEMGRRLALGTFKELNLIIKGDVDGSVEALSDSLLKLSTEEVQINIIHKAVGMITESDVLLATASDAIIIGFQVRPSLGAKKIAEAEQIEIRLYSIIYKAIEEMKDALEGLLEPDVEEVIVGNVQIRETFKISKIGTVAGCYVTDGYIKRSSTIRIIRDGIVVYSGEIGALKRFKDDVSEVKFGYECGLSIKNFNDLLVDDVIEVYEEREIKRKLK